MLSSGLNEASWPHADNAGTPLGCPADTGPVIGTTKGLEIHKQREYITPPKAILGAIWYHPGHTLDIPYTHRTPENDHF
jgi:hypothetical protein